jgi:DNA-binding IclR family transcriptional regulator
MVRLMKYDDAEDGRTGTQTIQRCATLLKLITAYNRTGMRLVDLYKAAGLTRPTTHRILQALVAERIIRQNERSKKYHLGSLVYEMGWAAASPFDLRDVCQPFLQHVAAATGDTVFLTLRSGFDGVCAGRAEGAYPIKAFVLDVGRRRPLNIGGGAVALLSGLRDDEIERIYQVNSKRIASDYPAFAKNAMWERIEHVRRKGYLINEVLEVQGIRSLAMPIVGPHGGPVGALSVSALKKRLSGTCLREKVEVLGNAVHEIQAKLQTEGRDEQG